MWRCSRIPGQSSGGRVWSWPLYRWLVYLSWAAATSPRTFLHITGALVFFADIWMVCASTTLIAGLLAARLARLAHHAPARRRLHQFCRCRRRWAKRGHTSGSCSYGLVARPRRWPPACPRRAGLGEAPPARLFPMPIPSRKYQLGNRRLGLARIRVDLALGAEGRGHTGQHARLLGVGPSWVFCVASSPASFLLGEERRPIRSPVSSGAPLDVDPHNHRRTGSRFFSLALALIAASSAALAQIQVAAGEASLARLFFAGGASFGAGAGAPPVPRSCASVGARVGRRLLSASAAGPLPNDGGGAGAGATGG